MKRDFKENYPKILLGLFFIFWIIIAISPKYRNVWFYENILTVLFIGFLVLTYKKFRFSNFTYSVLFFFMILHTIGSYYSYAEMPLFDLIKSLLGLSRNNYDRIVHFLFGLIFFFPIYEFISRKFNIKGSWGFLFVFLVIAALKGIFEIIEWFYVLITSSNILILTNYLGEQGDNWDAQKDMLFGVIGSIISWIYFGLRKISRNLYILV